MFLDANIFIYSFGNKEGASKSACANQLKRIINGEMRAQTSTLVLNEVLYYFENKYSKQDALRIFNNIISFKNLDILPVDRNALLYVSEFSNAGFEASDAYHAAVMKSNGLDTICTYDKAFDKAKGLKRQEPK